jgi:microcystin-dependent protein
MAELSKLSLTPVFHNGALASGAKLFFYNSGSTTAKTVYQDSDGTIAHSQPIVVPASGRVPAIYTAGLAHKVVITTSGGTVIETLDGLASETSAVSSGGGGGGTTIPPGFSLPAHIIGTVSGWVRANGRTIGSASSGATERANVDTEALFTALYNADANLSVSGGRGANAAADFAANKTLTLPDWRGRILAGLDAMGSTSSGRIPGAAYTSGSADVLGSVGGAATVTLTTAEIPAHGHAGTTAAGGAHTHTGTVDSGGAHTHTGTTATEGAHTHTGTSDSGGAHDHGGSTGAEGSHTHSGTTDAAGGFTPSGTVASTLNTGGNDLAYGNAGFSFTAGSTGALAVVGALTPGSGVTITSTFTGTAVSAHSHTFTTGAGSSHSHSISSQAAHTHTFTTGAGSAHSHTFTTDSGGAHTHTFTTASSATHTHTFTSDNTGGGGAHNNMPPFINVTWYIKL